MCILLVKLLLGRCFVPTGRYAKLQQQFLQTSRSYGTGLDLIFTSFLSRKKTKKQLHFINTMILRRMESALIPTLHTELPSHKPQAAAMAFVQQPKIPRKLPRHAGSHKLFLFLAQASRVQ